MKLSAAKFISAMIMLGTPMQSRAMSSEICKTVIERLPVFYTPRMLATNPSESPSSMKPRLFVRQILSEKLPVKIISPQPVSLLEFYAIHDRKFVNDVLMLRTRNGFGSLSEELNESLRYTTGSLVEAARYAIRHKTITCSPTSGFHHAGWNFCEGYCTFNGLMLAAHKLIEAERVRRVAIIDADYHWGNGTDDILSRSPHRPHILHYSFGAEFSRGMAEKYLEQMHGLTTNIREFSPDLVIYQAGADAHIDDPLGGVLTSEQMRERDRILFNATRNMAIPLVWNLAGGYTTDKMNTLRPVLNIHQQTVEEAIRATSN